jgi:cell division protein FtsB
MTTQRQKPPAFLRERVPQGPSRSTWSRKRSFAVGGAVVGLLLILPPLLGENGLPAYFQLRQKRDRLEREVAELRQRDKELEERTEAIQKDPQVLEQFARERYNMKREDEEVYEIVPPPDKSNGQVP